jgi:hypothetical protein
MPIAMAQDGSEPTTRKVSVDYPPTPVRPSSAMSGVSHKTSDQNGSRPEFSGPVRYIMETVDSSGRKVNFQQGAGPIKMSTEASPTVLEIIETRMATVPPRAPRATLAKADINTGPQNVTDEFGLSSLSVKSCRIRILSSKLINALRSVVKYYPGQNLLGDKLEFREPYQFLVHHREELKEYKTHHPPQHSESYRKECNEHIDHLLTFLDTAMGKELEDEEKRHDRDFCTFEYLWLLLKPGEDFFINGTRDDRVISGVLERFEEGYQGGEAETCTGLYWNIVYSDQRLYRLIRYFYILPFEGERAINTLFIYPTKYHKDTAEALTRQGGRTLAKQMVIWGEKYWNLTRQQRCLRDYHGKIYRTRNDRTVRRPWSLAPLENTLTCRAPDRLQSNGGLRRLYLRERRHIRSEQ